MATAVPSRLAQADLGQFQASFPAKRIGKKIIINWVMIAVCTLGVFTIPFAVWFLVITLRTPNCSAKARAKRVDLYEQGVVLVEQSGPVASFRFDGMSLLESITVRRANGIKVGTEHLLTLTGADGRASKVTQFYDRIEELGDAVQNGIVRYQLAGVQAVIEAGQAVPFGEFSVHRNGIVLPVGDVDWARYRSLNAQRGVLFVHVQEQKRAVFSRPIGQIPNYRLFLLTVKKFRVS